MHDIYTTQPLYNIFRSDKKQEEGQVDVEGRRECRFCAAVPILDMLQHKNVKSQN